MSTFTDWNGPNGYGGLSLPQVRTLEELMLRITQLQNNLNSIESALNAHKANGVAVGAPANYPHNLVAWDQTLSALLNDISSLQALCATLASTTAMTAGDTQTAAVAQANLNSAINTVNSAISALSAADTQLTADIAAVDAEWKAWLADPDADSRKFDYLSAQRKVPLDGAQKTLSTLRSVIDALQGIYGELYPKGVIDYRNMRLVNCYAHTIEATSNTFPNISKTVFIYGKLSKEWVDPSVIPQPTDNRPAGGPLTAERAKAGRAYLKFINSRPWNAIVDAVGTFDTSTSAGDAYDANINALVSRSTASSSVPLRPIAFGIYKSTNAGSDKNFYLGVQVPGEWAVDNALSGTPPYPIYLGGVNILPVLPTELSGTVTELAATSYNGSEQGMSVQDLVVTGNIFTDNYRDSDGHGVAITTRDYDTNGNPIPGTEVLHIGQKPVDAEAPDGQVQLLDFHSKTRPIVNMAGAEYDIAFLQDLAQSIYWQRDVKAVFDIAADLEDLYKTFIYYDSSGTPVPRGSINIDPTKTKRGIYLADPAESSGSIAVYPFAQDDVVLLKDSGSKQAEPDGKFNGYFGNGTDFDNPPATPPAIGDPQTLVPNSRVTGIPLPTANPAGTYGNITLVDDAGVYVKLTNYGAANFSLEVIGIPNTAPPPPVLGLAGTTFTLPGYVTFDGTNWGTPTAIPIQGHNPDVTYEWSGPASELSVTSTFGYYYEQTYVLWTAAHQNKEAYNDFNGDAWSNILLTISGYRSSARQDTVDTALEIFASTQPDFAEDQHLVSITLPEGTAKMVPNPAYIHNKPLVGTSVLDGGTFMAAPWTTQWHVDGGDFTGLGGAVVPGAIPPAAQQNSFRNMIMRLWHGNLADMPEYLHDPVPITAWQSTSNAPTAIWHAFDRTLRWFDDKKYLVYQREDDKSLHRIIPLDTLSSDVFDLDLQQGLSTNELDTVTFDSDLMISSPELRRLEELVTYNYYNDGTNVWQVHPRAIPGLLDAVETATGKQGVIRWDPAYVQNFAIEAGVISGSVVTFPAYWVQLEGTPVFQMTKNTAVLQYATETGGHAAVPTIGDTYDVVRMWELDYVDKKLDAKVATAIAITPISTIGLHLETELLNLYDASTTSERPFDILSGDVSVSGTMFKVLDMALTANDVTLTSPALVQIDVEIGDITTLATTATDVVAAINEINALITTAGTGIEARLDALEVTVDTATTGLVDKVAALEGKATGMNMDALENGTIDPGTGSPVVNNNVYDDTTIPGIDIAHGEIGWVLAHPPNGPPTTGTWVIGYDQGNNVFFWTF